MSLSLSLSNALSGLNINQQSLSILSQNIANANTQGYTRKIINQSAVYLDGRGAGVSIDNIGRRVDEFLLRSIRLQSSQAGRTSTISNFADRTQLLLGTPGSPNSLSNFTTNFFNSLQSLAQTPENATLRVNASNNGNSFAREIRSLATSLQDSRLQADNEIVGSINSINVTLRDLKELNDVITENTLLGKDVGDLQDRRDQGIRQLSEYIDIDTYVTERGKINIFTTSGVTLLDETAYQLAYSPVSSVAAFVADATLSSINVHRLNDAGQFVGQPTELVSAGRSSQVVSGLTGGTLRGLLDVRDKEIPNLLAQLDVFASNVRDEFNRTHNQGIGFPGANSYTGQRAVNAGSFSQWSGQSRIAILDNNGQPIASPYADETSGVRPLLLDLANLDTGNGPGFPSVQGIIDEVNRYYGPPGNKAVLGNLNNIRIASSTDTLPGSPPSFTFDFDLENISGTNADFFVSGFTVLDNTGADITAVTQNVPQISLAATGTYTTTLDSSTVTVATAAASGLNEGDRVYLSTPPGAVNGIPASQLGGYFTVSNVTDNGFDISTGSLATATGPVDAAAQTATPRYSQVDAGEAGRTTADGGITLDLSGNPAALFYTVSANVAVDDGNGNFTTSTITYQVDNTQTNLRNNRYSASTATGGGTIVAPTTNQSIARAIMVDANGNELTKVNGQYTTLENGFLRIVATNSTHTIGIDSLDSTELGQPNNVPPIAGTNRGFSHFFELNNFFDNFDNNGDSVTNSALNLFMQQRLIDNPNLISLGTLSLSQGSGDSNDPPLYTYERSVGDNTIIERLAALSNGVFSFQSAGGLGQSNTTIGGYASSIVGVAASRASSVQSDFLNAQTLVNGFSDRSDSISGVNLDEELANTIIYQNAYTASTRVISVVDELFDNLLNTFGR